MKQICFEGKDKISWKNRFEISFVIKNSLSFNEAITLTNLLNNNHC